MLGYKIIIPLWALYIMPFTIILALFTSFIYSGLTMFLIIFLCGLSEHYEIKASLGLKVGLAGAVAHWIGALTLKIALGGNENIPFTLITIFVAGTLIFIFDLSQLQKIFSGTRIALKIAVLHGIISAPWLFLFTIR